MFKKSKRNTANIRKRKADQQDSVEDNDEQTVILPEKQKKKAAIDSSSESQGQKEIIPAYEASGKAESLLPADMGATAVQEIDTERDKDATAILERSLQLQKELEGKEDDKI